MASRLRRLLFGSDEGRALVAMTDAESRIDDKVHKTDEAYGKIAELRVKIKKVLGPDSVAIRTDLANEADGDVGTYLGSLEEEYSKILEKLHENEEFTVGGRRSRHSRRRRKTKKRKPKTRKRKRLRRKRRSR